MKMPSFVLLSTSRQRGNSLPVLGVVLVMAGVSCATTRAADILPLFIFSGQSNAEGFGVPAELPANLQQAQPSVLFTDVYNNATPDWKPILAPTIRGFNIGPAYKVWTDGGGFGPELSAGLKLNQMLSLSQVAEVKYARGSTSLYNDWNPANSSGLYNGLIQRVQSSVAALQALNPTKQVKISGFFWMQGEGDADGGTMANAYQANLTNFISSVRSDLKVPNLPFVIGQLGPAYNGSAVAQAQANIGSPKSASHVAGTAVVKTNDLPMIFDNIHYATSGVLALGERFATSYSFASGKTPFPILNDANLLSDKPVVASSIYNGSYPASLATDGTENQLIFADNTPNRMVIHGLNGTLSLIRIWRDTTDPHRVPSSVMIKGSASDQGLLTDPFEVILTNPDGSPVSLSFSSEGYADIPVTATTRLRSLYVDFGNADSNGDPYGVRIVEIQAFASPAVPEPGTAALGVVSLGGLLMARRRKGL